jgi:hypothetical protein
MSHACYVCYRLVVQVAVIRSCPHAVAGGEQQAGEAVESAASNAATEALSVDTTQIEMTVLCYVPSFGPSGVCLPPIITPMFR